MTGSEPKKGKGKGKPEKESARERITNGRLGANLKKGKGSLKRKAKYKIPKFQNTKIPKFHCIRIPKFQNSTAEILEFPTFFKPPLRWGGWPSVARLKQFS